ncbi:MAG: dTMP kinase, partial [Anaerolineales bacterium]|nr:dTMP kinase [Anaerolineales bacterium]
YQGYGRGLNLDNLHTLTRIATGGLKPDLTLLLDIDVERGLARRQVGGEEMNRLDLEAVTFHQRVRRGYHALAAAEPGRWITIDADRPVDEVQVDLCTAVLARLSRHQANPA